MKEQIKLFKNLNAEIVTPPDETTETEAEPKETTETVTETEKITETETETEKVKEEEKQSNLMPFLYTAAAVVLAAAIAVGAFIFHKKKSEKLKKKNK